jgi:regulation of enolase protein 1 (concanavalin A-like superfamily)
MEFTKNLLHWINEPSKSLINENKIEIVTDPNTDFWQRTYYGFRNDNAPALLMETTEKFFSFQVKTEFNSKHRFDQCGIIIYQDCDNWSKASIEYENEDFQRLGSVVTNHGYSDWATTDISADIKSMYYRLSRRKDDFCIEYSYDGTDYKQMRIFHLFEGSNKVNFGIYACSPTTSSFTAIFTEMEIAECKWLEHK